MAHENVSCEAGLLMPVGGLSFSQFNGKRHIFGTLLIFSPLQQVGHKNYSSDGYYKLS